MAEPAVGGDHRPPLARAYAAPALVLRGRTLTWGSRTFVMGIVNVTPDSFSGDGTFGDPARAAAIAARMEADGADIIEVGAESSRPGATELAPSEECARLLPSLRAVRAATALPIAVDTYHADVAAAALDEGADMVNDIHGLRRDPGMAVLLARRLVPVVAMHNQRGLGGGDVVRGVSAGFEATLAEAGRAGVEHSRVILDPGFGFGWRAEANLEMVRRLPEFWHLGLPLLIGPSRKSTIGQVLRLPVNERLEGTAALVALAIAGGADIVRVHDVQAMVRVARIADAVVRANWRASDALSGAP